MANSECIISELCYKSSLLSLYQRIKHHYFNYCNKNDLFLLFAIIFCYLDIFFTFTILQIYIILVTLYN